MGVRDLWRIAALMVLFSLISVLSMPVPARAAGVPIEGNLLVEYSDESTGSHAYFMEGSSSTVVPMQALNQPDISPDTTKAAYNILISGDASRADVADIWVSNIDGSGATNITGPTGLGGVNCFPTWSADARMIAFQHATPAIGQQRCGNGWQVWLMNADGTNLHQWLTSPTYITESPSWSPDGYSLACQSADQSCVTGDITGANVTALLGVNGRDVQWSRDGSKIAYTTMLSDTVGGETGVWDQLCLADPDGSNVQVVAQQFLKDSDLQAHIAKYNFQPSTTDWVGQIRWIAGPRNPKWSPLGDQVAFLAALPFDPNGAEFWYQIEVWLYDLNTQQLTRVTTDTYWDDWLSWTGPNTTSTHPAVTVGSTSVTFPQVDKDGWTSIMRTEVLPPLPTSYLRLDNFYQITSTAQVSGPATVAMSYADAEIAATAESHIAMLLYDAATSQWEDTTTSRDATNKVVSGEASELGLMGLAYPLPTSDFSDVSSSTSDPYWALWEIEAAYAAGIVKGYSDGTYKPTDPVTRDQMAVYISRALAGGDAAVPSGPATATFSDVATDYWAFKYVEYAVDKGVVKGYSDGTYKPADQVTRDQMSVFIARAIATPADGADLVNYTPPATATFPDVPTTFWAYKYVEYIAQPSIAVTKGYPDGDYHPEYVCTRDQMAVYVARAFSLQ
ncbi:MAG: S-layer homology domain-containing protein [Armatimonadota bacterium]